MFIYKVFVFLTLICVANCEVDETMCKNDYRDMNNVQIDLLKYCSNKNMVCVEKCCGEGEIFTPKSICEDIKKMVGTFKKVKNLLTNINYTNVVLFSWNATTKNKTVSEKDFVFVRNNRDVGNCTSEHEITNDFFILEDGSIRMQDTSRSKSWSVIKKQEYCIDFKLDVINKKTPAAKAVVQLVVREYNADRADENKKATFVLVGLLISSFFLLLVFVVYCLLPKLQNLIGLVLMAYTASLLITFIFKISIHLSNMSLTTKGCKILSPMMYFTAVSSFFWLNVMSFDVWWSLRGFRKRCDINRRGERVKFMWYCLYAWGAPLLMTALVTAVDNIDLSDLSIIKPPFDDCFVSEDGVKYYFIIPIGIIIFVNIILFLLTVYNIWMIKRSINRCQDSRSSKQDTNRFATYIKLSVVMGVSWSLELIPADTQLWVFILTTTYNLLIGVAIFFLFVFKKEILIKLCKRFNIKNNFTRNFELLHGSRSGTTRTTGTSSVKDQHVEMDLLKNCPKGESHIDTSNTR